jgi:hypothetical protein
VSAIAEFGQRVAAARHTLRQIEQQHSKYNEDLAGLLTEVAECANRKRAEMMECKAQYEGILDDYAQLKDLLHSPVLTSEASLQSSLGDVIRDLDADMVEMKYPAAASVKLADYAIVEDENIAKTDPDRVRLGLQRAFKKRRSHAVKAEKAAN